jgi:hypothetical protein
LSGVYLLFRSVLFRLQVITPRLLVSVYNQKGKSEELLASCQVSPSIQTSIYIYLYLSITIYCIYVY